MLFNVFIRSDLRITNGESCKEEEEIELCNIHAAFLAAAAAASDNNATILPFTFAKLGEELARKVLYVTKPTTSHQLATTSTV